MVIKTTKNELGNKHLEGLSILAFRATWCPPCQMMGPELERLSELHSDIKIFDVDVDQNIVFAREMKVNGIPSFFLYKDGELIENTAGYMPAEELAKKLGK
ncbi:thioredoxin [Metamycoplasma cloacale]|uniref:Thioredoxin n=1 Tax=Metamycoplasma cloacale TaxID=92401 RepID=A0A2Z4LLE6_9BACT|nr:thioredoxin family protein [Metamycoplasma cloacale]AWX42582.1 thioredoxin [Metamycoplasma cloacale]VEU79702.1 thioredoxin [Metamycoplasma cloacale]